MFIRSSAVMKYIKRIGIGILIIGVMLFACDPGPTAGAYLSVSQHRCVGCGECVKVCDADAIIIISNKAVIDLSKCIECGQCIDACPYDAIQ